MLKYFMLNFGAASSRMGMPRKDVTMSENDALPLEYKLNWGRARRQVDAGNFMNHPLVEPEDSVLGLRLEKEILDLGLRQLRPFTNNRSDF